MRKRAGYLIQDPYDSDAIEFIRTIFRTFGLRPICLYTDPRARFYGEIEYPLLTSDLIEASVDISERALADVVSELSERYDIRAVIPYREDAVEMAAELCDLLDLDWNDAATLSLFRDKFAMKTFVAERDPSVRVPACRIVEKVDDVWDQPPSRFVIKPNDGLGNQRIGIFDDTESDAVRAHVESDPPTTWILEEFIGGTEYHIDGQVRTDGEVTVLAVFEYMRVEVNNYPTVYAGELQIKSDDPLFAELSTYAARLLTATGLRGCPFHLEVKVDDKGPCVVDLGARFPSDGGALVMNTMHPDRPDVYSVAVHDYFGPNNFATDPPDFTFADENPLAIAYGISRDAGPVRQVEGLDTVEARWEFLTWAVKPQIGDKLVVTKDLRGAPYIAILRHHGGEVESRKLIAEVQETVRWNQGGDRLAAARGTGTSLARRATTKLRWTIASLTERARAKTS